MPATAQKNARTLQASTPVASGGSQTSTTWNLTTALGGTLQARVTIGTALSAAATITVNVSVDGTNWRTLTAWTSPTAVSTTDWFLELPEEVMYAQVVFTQAASGQSITVEAFGHELTSIG